MHRLIRYDCSKYSSVNILSVSPVTQNVLYSHPVTIFSYFSPCHNKHCFNRWHFSGRMSSRQWSSSQRPPLNPLLAGQHNTMKGSDSSTTSTRAPLAAAQQSLCKRHSPDNPGFAESENAPLSLHNKRQRTKSGSDSIEPLIPSCQDSAIPPTDSASGKGESMPLCEHNVRTSRIEVGQEASTPNSEPSCSCSQRDSVSSSSNSGSNGNSDSVSNLVSGENLRTDATIECKNDNDLSQQSSVGLYTDHLPLASGSTSGGLSPHCAATLEYVTQLPEGCSGGGADPSVLEAPSLNSACVPDEELEDDDNYLDSSEEELEDELTLTNNEDEESCGEGELFHAITGFFQVQALFIVAH